MTTILDTFTEEVQAKFNTELDEGMLRIKKIRGNLVEYESEHGGWHAYYGELYRELFTLKRKGEIELRKKEGELHRFYIEKYPRQLDHRTIQQYVNSDSEYVKLSNQLEDVIYLEGKFANLVKSYEMIGWRLGDIVKLHIAGIDGIEL